MLDASSFDEQFPELAAPPRSPIPVSPPRTRRQRKREKQRIQLETLQEEEEEAGQVPQETVTGLTFLGPVMEGVVAEPPVTHFDSVQEVPPQDWILDVPAYADVEDVEEDFPWTHTTEELVESQEIASTDVPREKWKIDVSMYEDFEEDVCPWNQGRVTRGFRGSAES